MGSVLGQHLQQILAVEPCFALGHLVEWIAHEYSRECRLTGTIGTHDGVSLTIFDHEIDSFQYFLLAYSGVQVFYF